VARMIIVRDPSFWLNCSPNLQEAPDFKYKELFPLNEPNGAIGGDKTEYRKISGDYVEKVETDLARVELSKRQINPES